MPRGSVSLRWSNKGDPEEPGSVVPTSQSTTRTWVLLPGDEVPPYEVICVAWFSKLIFLSSPLGWWMATAELAGVDDQLQPA